MSFLWLRWTVDVKYYLLHRLCGQILAASNDVIYCVMGEVDSGRGKCIFFELSNWAMNINMQKNFSNRASAAAVMCSLLAMLEVFGISSGEQLITFLSLKPSHLNNSRGCSLESFSLVVEWLFCDWRRSNQPGEKMVSSDCWDLVTIEYMLHSIKWNVYAYSGNGLRERYIWLGKCFIISLI